MFPEQAVFIVWASSNVDAAVRGKFCFLVSTHHSEEEQEICHQALTMTVTIMCYNCYGRYSGKPGKRYCQ